MLSLLFIATALPFACNANLVRGCYDPHHAYSYQGSVSATVSGRTCQAWSQQTPHKHRFVFPTLFVDQQFPDNRCRSPEMHPDSAAGDTGRPWCFTTDPDTVWELCDVPVCAGSDDDCERDSDCDEKEQCVKFRRDRRGICIDPPPSLPTYTYTLYGQEVTADEARSSCLSKGQHLAMPKTQAQLDALERVLRKEEADYWDVYPEFHIDIRKTPSGVWLWDDGEEVQEAYWKHGEPTLGDCAVYLYQHMSALNSYCDFKRPYICQKGPTNTLKSFEPRGPVTSSDPHGDDQLGVKTVYTEERLTFSSMLNKTITKS